jgi:acetyl esterase/lipase
MFVVLFLLSYFSCQAQTNIDLYEGKIPNSKDVPDAETSETKDGILRIAHISKPTLTIFALPKIDHRRTAVIICPGGGYRINAFGKEGTDVAKKLNDQGIVAFVLKYRIPDDATMINKEIGPLQDAQQAIRFVRENASKWNVDPNRVGIMGFSAGGHLASTASTHFDHNYIEGSSAVNLKPDFSILVYPVISFTDSLSHGGSRTQLLGNPPSLEKIKEYSNELHITKDTPPAFLVHASDDGGVSPLNSVVYYENLTRKKVPAELHIYQKGGHGFGLNNKTTEDNWMERCVNWMKSLGMLSIN